MTLISRLESAARVHRTPCGSGHLVWREWGGGSPVVLLHGGFGSWLHWVRNIDALAHRHRVLTVDLPGLGDSALPEEPITPEAMGRPVADGLRRLVDEGEPVDLVGFSFGGLVSGQVARILGPRVRSLTLVGSSGLGLPRERTELIRRTPDMSPEALLEAQRHNLLTLMLYDRNALDDQAMAIQAHNDLRARVKSRRLSLGDSLRQALPHLHGELHGIWGEHDVTGTPRMEGQRALLEQLRPGGEFHLVPGAGHWVQYEASERFNSLLQALLSD